MSAVGSLAALKIETKPRGWVRIEPALRPVVGLGGGMLQSLALGTLHHARPGRRRLVRAGVWSLFRAARHLPEY